MSRPTQANTHGVRGTSFLRYVFGEYGPAPDLEDSMERDEIKRLESEYADVDRRHRIIDEVARNDLICLLATMCELLWQIKDGLDALDTRM